MLKKVGICLGTQKNPSVYFVYSVSIVVLMTGLKGLELRDLLNISLWIRCAWSAGNYFSHRLQSQKYPVIPHKQ